MKAEINWKLNRSEFRKHIESIIDTFGKQDNAMVIPMHAASDKRIVTEQIATILSMVTCGSCHKCCTSSKFGFIVLQESDRRLIKKIHSNVPDHLEYPCPYLNSSGCSIYDHRPLVCRTFPLQLPSTDQNNDLMLTISLECPLAKEIVIRIFMVEWDLYDYGEKIKRR